jgi:hypothetical protein
LALLHRHSLHQETAREDTLLMVTCEEDRPAMRQPIDDQVWGAL